MVIREINQILFHSNTISYKFSKFSLEYNFVRTFDIYSKLCDYYISFDTVYPYIFFEGLILKAKTNKNVN